VTDNGGVQALPARKWRIALYSPGMFGLGHMRRNLLIAQTLARSAFDAAILLVAEARQANAFALPAGVDCLTLPALRKDVDGQCQPRYLDLPLADLTALRASVIRASLAAFEPDVLLVDHLPRGAARELDPALEHLRANGSSRCLLGLRDVLQDPETVRREWDLTASEDAIRAYYDAVWVYGDPAVFDTVRECHLPDDVAAKVRYTGYLDQRARTGCAEGESTEWWAELGETPDRLVLCLVGGGQDGAFLAEAFVQAELPPGTTGVLLTGPFMPPEVLFRLRRRAAERARLRVHGFVTDPELLLRRADHVIATGGYNTVCEVLSFEKHALIVPRVGPRREQLIRAERLRDLGLLDMLHPDEVTPGALSEWLARDKGSKPQVRERVDLNGLARIPTLLAEVLAASAHPTPGRSPEEVIAHVAR
jgi:predicted glycosyltransferase